MGYRHSVVLTANNRPKYLRQVLASWAACPGIQQARLEFLCEPGCPETPVIAAAASAWCDDVTVLVNPQTHGVLSNPWFAFQHGFEHSRFVIVGEDDTIVAPDVLGFFAQADAMYRARPEVLAVTPFRHHAPPDPDLAAIGLTTAFESTVWATWEDRWTEVLRDSWDHDYSHRGFDWHIQAIADDHGFVFAAPELSRAQHIGILGTHCRPGQFGALQSTCFSQNLAVTRFHPGRASSDRPARESA